MNIPGRICVSEIDFKSIDEGFINHFKLDSKRRYNNWTELCSRFLAINDDNFFGSTKAVSVNLLNMYQKLPLHEHSILDNTLNLI